MALGPHQIPYINQDKINAAEKMIDQLLLNKEWLSSKVNRDGAKRCYWTIHITGSFSELERGTLCQKYLDVGWGYVTTHNNESTGFDLELCEKETK